MNGPEENFMHDEFSKLSLMIGVLADIALTH